MRVVPNDDQQAEAIVELILKNGGGKTGILSTDTYDARYAVMSLAKALEQATDRSPLIIHADSLDQQIPKILARIQECELDHLILPFDAALNKELLVSLIEAKPSLKLYGTLHFTMGAEIRKIPWKLYEGMYVISVGPIWISNSQITGNNYLFPPAREASAQDAVTLVIQAIKKVGTNREDIKKHLLEIQYEGITGPIAFDEMGNRTRLPVVARIEQGKRVVLYHR
jgi:ABC-type branched-subunit amino acid transport system substrate-binding protein